jgi:CheY-like chemotaxis protein
MNKQILVVDDDEDDRFLIKSSFEAAGDGNSLSFADGPDGVSQYLIEVGKPPRVIIMDLKMPHKNGIQVLKDIRNNPFLNATPVIIYSSENNPEQIKACYQSGANSFIVKPSTFAAMVSVAEVILNYWLRTAALPVS